MLTSASDQRRMADNVYKFRTIKHGDPEKKLGMIPNASPKATTLFAFTVLTILCGLLAFAIVYAARL